MSELYRFPCGCTWPILEVTADGGIALDFDVEKAPQDCPAVWDLLGKGLTKGVFQLESSLGKQWTKKLRPERIEHLGALGALLRPGPLKGVDENGVSLTEHYCRRKNGEEEVTDFHPALKSILQDTYGVLAFQEQSMRMAKELAGFGLTAVDKLRKGIGKKDQELLARIGEEFIEGCRKTGIIDEQTIQQVWGWIKATGRYQFNRAHSECYGHTGYDTAYLKAHVPLAFFASWLEYARSSPKPKQEIFELVQDARLFDIEVLVPDLRISGEVVTIHEDRIYLGLSDIKGNGRRVAEQLRSIVHDAEAWLEKPIGSFSWLEVLAHVADRLPSGVLKRCAQAGALSWLGLPREQLVHELSVLEGLTDKEDIWLRALLSVSSPSHSLPRLQKALGEVETTLSVEPAANDVAAVSALKRQKLWRERLQLEVQLSEAGRRASCLAEALEELSRPRYKRPKRKSDPEPSGPFGACNDDKRERIVAGLAASIRKPATALADAPHRIAWLENDLLGIAITCSKVDSCDIGEANCTCKEFASGRTGYLMLAVEVNEARVMKTRRGKTPGASMAYLTISDGSAALTNVVCFPDVWKEYGYLLTEGNTVLVHGERDRHKDSSQLIIKEVWQAS